MKDKIQNITTRMACQPRADIESVRIPVLLWAEIGNSRIEEMREINLKIGRGWCHKLAFENSAEPMAKLIFDMEVKSGYEVITANASLDRQEEAR